MSEELLFCEICKSKAVNVYVSGEGICCTNQNCINRYAFKTIKEWNKMTRTQLHTKYSSWRSHLLWKRMGWHDRTKT